jgi:predicted DsbA family dithiol-disulfide isomerase
MKGMTALPIDFVADPVCPWCYLGWARLKAALAARPDLEPSVTWRAYQLDPTVPAQGVDRKAYMTAKFGDPSRMATMSQRLKEAAAEAGLSMRFDDIPLRPNTNAAHRLIRWAQGEGRGVQAAEAVMQAYWTDLKDIGDPEVLADLASAIGMDRDAVLARLRSEEDRDLIDQEHAAAARMGITGVPFTVFANRIAVSGAEPSDRLLLAIDKALEPAAQGRE